MQGGGGGGVGWRWDFFFSIDSLLGGGVGLG